MVLAVIMIAAEYGGITSANELAASLVPDLFSHAGADGHYTPKKWFSFMIFWAFCVPMFPQLFMRYYIAENPRYLKKSIVLYALAPLFISILPVMIGVWGHLTFPGLEGQAADQILPMMLKAHTTDWFSALVMTGAIAAFMSTLDSQLLALSTMITRNFCLPVSGKKISFKQEVFIGRLMVGLLATIGLLISFHPFDTIFDMGKMAFSGIAILFPVGLAATRFKIIKPHYLSGAILFSLVLLFGFYYNWIPSTLAFGFEYFVILIVMSFLLSAIGVRRKEHA